MENWRLFTSEKIILDSIESTAPLSNSARKELDEDHERWRTFAENAGYHFDRKLGEGAMGDVFLVEDKETGQRLAMKVVTQRLYGGPKTAKRERDNYKFAMNNKSSMDEQYAKYIPDVYGVLEGQKDYFIFMELLEPIPNRIKSDLFALDWNDESLERTEKYKRIFRDPQAVNDIITNAVTNDHYIRQIDNDNIIIKNKTAIVNDTLKTVLDTNLEDLSAETIVKAISSSILSHIKQNQDSSEYYDIIQQLIKSKRGMYDPVEHLEYSLKDIVEWYLNKQIIPVHGSESDQEDSTHGQSEKSIVDQFPESHGLIDAIRYFFQDQKWEPKDIHSGNVMIRPASREFVITDLGLFRIL
jgi:serine/threonine protein kinase